MSDNNQANEHDNNPEGAGEEEVPVEQEEFANSEENGDTANYTWWDGQWPAAHGKIARDLAKNAGTALEQKELSKEIYAFLKHENSQLSLLNGRTDNVAYLVNIPGTKLLRVGYGLSPKVTNLLNPDAATTLRMMMGEVDESLTPEMISFPSSVKDGHKYRIPTDTMIDSVRDKWPATWPVFKFNELKDNNGNDVTLMKIAPVPFFVVQDGLDEDLEAGLLLERIQSMADFADEEYLQHAANFLKACLVQYQANQKKPSLETVAFTARATREDKKWTQLRFTQFFPDLMYEQLKSKSPEQSNDLATVLKMLLDQNKAKEVVQPAPSSAREDEASEALEGTWEKKLNLSTTALKNMIKFCGLEDGEEHRLPQYLIKLAEKHNTKGDKDTIIHQVLSKAYYQDAEVPITSFLLSVVRERNWTGGEVICTMANCMKGLSIFAMKDISDEALSRMNEEEDAHNRATHTSPKDHMLSTKWKPEVPVDTAELIKYFQRYVNVLSALTMGQNPHCHHAQQIVGKLKRWSPAACKAMKTEMIASIMWVTLKEARRSFMGIDHNTLPEFDELMDCLDKKKEFVVLDLPAALVKVPLVEQDLRPKRPREVLDPKKPGGPKKPRVPNPATNIGQNAIIGEKCASLLKVMGEHKISLSKLCKACNTEVHNLVPKGVCGQSAFFGQCYVRNCGFDHRKLNDDEVWKLLDCILPALDNPNIVIPKGQ